MLGGRYMMPNVKVKLLIVDDEPLIRTSLSLIFTTFGYSVRSAEDGFSALGEIRNEIPDILLSDLNMPGMSGFELLSVVRRRFPAIQVIAMSGAFFGDGVPLGVAADAFYDKGGNPESLLRIVQAMAQMEGLSVQHLGASAPVWVPKNGHDPSGEEYVMMTCPECLRAFPQVLCKDVCLIRETRCAHCSSPVHYAIVQPADPTFPQAFQRKPQSETSRSLNVSDF
jgi:CheY-like chemotaxis protein